MRHLIKIALFLLAGVAAFFVYGFTSQVAPVLVAVLAAGSLVGTYIGLAFAEIPGGQRDRARHVAIAAMVIEALYGWLYVLSLQYPAFFATPPVIAAILLAALHGASFSVLAYFVSLFVVHEERGAVAASPEQQLVTVLEVLASNAEQQGMILKQLAAPAPALPRQETYPDPVAVGPSATLAVAETKTAYDCPTCGGGLTQGQYGAAKRHGHCHHCR